MAAVDVVARDVRRFRLEPADPRGDVTPAPAGAHVEFTFAGLRRCYSLTSPPHESRFHEVTVQRARPGRGGSAGLHDALGVGDAIEGGEPVDGFPFEPTSGLMLLIGGGIGLTPLLGMAGALAASGRPFDLHAAARSAAHLVPLPSPLPDGFKDLFVDTKRTALPLVADRVERVDPARESEIAPGVVLIPAPGHTPHSMVVMIASGDEQVLYASDTTLLVRQNAIAPEWVSAFEHDADALVKTRLALLDRAATDGLGWFGYHASFPALGRIRRTGGTFEFVPDPWNWS